MIRAKFALLGVVATVVIAALLFGSAGRWDVPQFWVYLGLWVLVLLSMVLTMDPELMRERLRPGGRSQDNLFLLRFVGMVVVLGQWVLAGLDVGRFHWSDTIPSAVQIGGGLLFAASLVVVRWAQQVNRFFSAAVRIQSERGHHVITTGPYATIRHPGYACFILGWISSGLLLGSWLATLPAFLFSVAFVRRAALEDRFLQAELPGYAEYAGRVRYRLLPGVW